MPIRNAESTKQQILETYQEKTKGSAEQNKTARRFLPGGDTRAVAYHAPYPFFAASGKGCCLYDCDGNETIDFVNNFTALIHGHAHPHVVEALVAQAGKGTAHGVPTQLQYQLAQIICDRVPSMDSLRYCNSGTEATLFAMRAARAFTGKNGFLRMDGGYNGSHDFVEVNITPDMAAEDLPAPTCEKGVSDSVLNDIYIAPFNDLEKAERILVQNKDHVAAILMEPMLGAGGLVMPAPGYLHGMRAL
ncbi:MAG: aminotransferase class III-fold pyridoxal phosphate-dependent enzyme, partial [Deltaproteobacteria bacterium]|nr:aminotransferase class III-fold pyridoxal phosphate-dependent enzyme [Deltaproteobacteria bacterium]